MKPIMIILSMVLLAACNNNSTTTSTTGTADSTQVTVHPNWSNEGTTDFLNNCVANAQQSGRYKDEKQAFAYCNCILNQIKQKYPSLDSAQSMLNDTVQVMKLQANCK